MGIVYTKESQVGLPAKSTYPASPSVQRTFSTNYSGYIRPFYTHQHSKKTKSLATALHYFFILYQTKINLNAPINSSGKIQLPILPMLIGI
jgi:hypothetical protein